MAAATRSLLPVRRQPADGTPLAPSTSASHAGQRDGFHLERAHRLDTNSRDHRERRAHVLPPRQWLLAGQPAHSASARRRHSAADDPISGAGPRSARPREAAWSRRQCRRVRTIRAEMEPGLREGVRNRLAPGPRRSHRVRVAGDQGQGLCLGLRYGQRSYLDRDSLLSGPGGERSVSGNRAVQVGTESWAGRASPLRVRGEDRYAAGHAGARNRPREVRQLHRSPDHQLHRERRREARVTETRAGMTNARLLIAFAAFQFILFPIPIITLFWKDQIRMSLADIMVLQAISGLSVALFEFPSGYLADRVGYRRSLLVGTSFLMAGWLLYTRAESFWAVAEIG